MQSLETLLVSWFLCFIVSVVILILTKPFGPNPNLDNAVNFILVLCYRDLTLLIMIIESS